MPKVNNFHGAKSIIHFFFLLILCVLLPHLVCIHTTQALNSDTWVLVFTLRHAEWIWKTSINSHICHTGFLWELSKRPLTVIHFMYYLYSKSSNMLFSFTVYTTTQATNISYMVYFNCLLFSLFLSGSFQEIDSTLLKMTKLKIQNLSYDHSA